MITGELKNKVDKIWEIFWTGGITNPLEVIEQFNYLLFIKQLDEVETRKERDANILGIPYEGICILNYIKQYNNALTSGRDDDIL